MEDTNRFSRKALSDALERRNLRGDVGFGAFFNFFRVKFDIGGRPKVSIIIPTRDQLPLLDKLLTSLREKSSWPNYEIIVVDNQSGPKTRAYLKHSSVKTLRAPYPFNFSLMMNQGAEAAGGEYLLFLNNDMEIIESEWLEALLQYAQLRGVGAVGAKLIYPDITIQHAGVVLGLSHNTVAGHIFQGLHSASPGYQGWINTVRNVSAVTAACMMTPRELFRDMGGFEPKLGVAFQDVDYCLRLVENGYRIVYTPYSCLIHYESVTRGRAPDRGEEVRYMHERWGRLIADDPCYNPNLTLIRPDATLRN
ncbi:MAG: glycosyltransferase family 2 protein [Deltaproteobacteria bacterium]|nr:glycosyltransferase family 2 protein [Deltaproteobacteria bacterium]